MRHRPDQDDSPRFTRGDSPEPVVPMIRRRKSEIDSHIERQIITGMILSDGFLEKIVQIFSPDSFQAPFARRVAEWCVEHFEKYHKAPSLSIEGIYEKQKKTLPNDEATLLGEFLGGLSEQNERNKEFGFDVEFNLDEAKRYFRLCALKTLNNKIQQSITTERPEEGDEAVERYKSMAARINTKNEEQEEFTAKELQDMKIPEPKWIIRDLLVEGLSALGGKPKKGKSLFALNILLAVSSGIPALGNIPVKTGPAIYLALEDTKRRLQGRINRMLKGKPFPADLILCPQDSFPRMPNGLVRLEAKIKKYSPRLVVIDTWGRFKPPDRSTRIDPYDVSVEDVGQLKDLADRYGVAILIIHHMRKTGSEDIIDAFYGTVGLTATADSLLAFVRKGQQPEAVLHVQGRDVEPQEIALKLDPASLTWESMGAAAEVQSTANRQAIVDAILSNEAPMAPKAIAQATGLKLGYINVTVQRMFDKGLLTRTEWGKYDVPIDARLRWKENREKVVQMRRRRGN